MKERYRIELWDKHTRKRLVYFSDEVELIVTHAVQIRAMAVRRKKIKNEMAMPDLRDTQSRSGVHVPKV